MKEEFMKQFKYITLIDEKETKEAKEYLNHKRGALCWIFIVPLFITLLTFLLGMRIPFNLTSMPVIITSAILASITLLLFILYIFLLIPYHKLLKIAKHNDKVRHDEKIRFNERKRLEIEHDTYNKKDIAKTIESDI